MDAQGGHRRRPSGRSRANEPRARKIRWRIRPAGYERAHARIPQRLLVARGGAVEAALQLEYAAMGTPAEPRSPAPIPPRSLIHDSAYQRGSDYAKRLPPDGIPTS